MEDRDVREMGLFAIGSLRGKKCHLISQGTVSRTCAGRC
jgi:hypothetical protein